MTNEQVQLLFRRIDKLTSEHKPLFGKMSVNQMVCHCTDQLRLAMGTMKLQEYKMIDPEEVIALSRAGKTVPTPKGFRQAEGEGTKPTHLENDKKILKEQILKFTALADDCSLAPHPYFGLIDKKRWTEITICHFNHHLKQFNV